MPRLLGALLLLLPKRRLMDEQIRPLRSVDDASTGPRVTREHNQPTRPLRAHDPLGAHCPPVRQCDRLTFLQLPPQGSLRHARGARFLRIEPPGAFMLLEGVPDGPPTVVSSKHVNVVPFPFPLSPFPNYPWSHFLDLDLERHPLHAELNRLAKDLLPSLRAVQPHGVRTRLETERTDQPDHAEKMVRVEMREENLGQSKAHPVAHHLALGALAALEQKSLALAHQGHRRDIALDC